MMTGAAYLVASTILYGLFSILSRTVGLAIPIFYQNATRNLTAAIILIVIVTMQHAWKRVAPRDFWLMFLRAIAGSVAFLSFFYTIIALPVGPAYFIFYAGSTLFGFLFGHYLFSEHLTKIKIVCLGLALLGLLMVYQVNISVVSPFYFGLALFSGATTSLWEVLSKKITKAYAPSYISFWDEILSAANYTIASVIMAEHWQIPTLSPEWAASLGLGVFFVATGILMVAGFRRLEAQIGTIILLAEIPFAIFFAWLFYRESVSLLTIVGGACIIAAIVLPEIYTSKK